MDLQVYLIIVTVFFVSLGSLLFVTRQLRGGKTYEEALAEKRQLTEKLYGSKKKNAAKKSNTGKKASVFIQSYIYLVQLTSNHLSFIHIMLFVCLFYSIAL